MDGLACTRRIRDLEREGKITGQVPVIAVTANTRIEQMEQALEAGMVTIISPKLNVCCVANWAKDDIVAKPFHIPELMQKADQLLTKQKS